jgi:hypothetical protein
VTTELEDAPTQPAAAPNKPRQLTQSELQTRFNLTWHVKPGTREVVVDEGWKRVMLVSIRPVINGHAGAIWLHKDAAPAFAKFFELVHAAKLDDRILVFSGSFVPRFKRGTGGTSPADLSRHSRGIAIDLNAAWNAMGTHGPKLGERGCLDELAPLAYECGIVWGGDWKGASIDKMHYELGEKT